jgi:murein DD-endopeptidase MepM/ murein hydrolase activator NlpD
MQPSRVQFGPYLLRLVLPLGLVLLAAGLLSSTRRLDAFNRSPYPLAVAPRFNPLAALPTPTSRRLDQARIPVQLTLLRGETATQIFAKLGLGGVAARDASDALAEHINLKALKAGSRYSAFFNPDASLASLAISLDGNGRFEMVRQGDAWKTVWQPFARTVEMRTVSATLDGSFEGSIRAGGGPSTLAYRMADVLRWDLDFNRDLKQGDRFQVLYEQVKLDGQDYTVGNVLAMVYEGSEGRRHEAYNLGDGSYYDGDGRPLQKMFLRSPLRYSYVTSSFSMHRFHPVLNEFRPHYGVDYHAPVGTPVQVTANGTVVSAGWDGGGGNVVKVRHADGYVTAYLHLSRFAPGIHAGAAVRQGDTIAFTGATGLATGPHLDYRVKHNDQWVDPLSLKGVRDEPIPAYQLASFRSWRDAVRASLASGAVPASLPSPPRIGRPELPQTQLVVAGPAGPAGRARRPGVARPDLSITAAGR